MRKALWLWLLLLSGLPVPARAVDVAIVLLTDVSRSVDAEEYAMVKAGYLAAFNDPEVVAALAGHPDGVALAYVEFSGRGEVTMVHGWAEVSDAATASAFADAVARAPRSAAGNTDLAAALATAARMLDESDFGMARRVIDVASDETGDPRSPSVRDSVVAGGITINAIPIASDDERSRTARALGTVATIRWGSGSIGDYYRRDVIGGPGSFVIEATDHTAFGEALKRKLLLELLAGLDRVGPL